MENIDLRACYEEKFFTPSGEYDPSLSSYDSMVGTFCDEIVCQMEVGDYQGDTFYILRKGEEYGFLVAGWGSCSGCDALAGCDTYDQLVSLRDDLERSTHWERDFVDMCLFLMKKKDWNADFYWSSADKIQSNLTSLFVRSLRGAATTK